MVAISTREIALGVGVTLTDFNKVLQPEATTKTMLNCCHEDNTRNTRLGYFVSLYDKRVFPTVHLL